MLQSSSDGHAKASQPFSWQGALVFCDFPKSLLKGSLFSKGAQMLLSRYHAAEINTYFSGAIVPDKMQLSLPRKKKAGGWCVLPFTVPWIGGCSQAVFIRRIPEGVFCNEASRLIWGRIFMLTFAALEENILGVGGGKSPHSSPSKCHSPRMGVSKCIKELLSDWASKTKLPLDQWISLQPCLPIELSYCSSSVFSFCSCSLPSAGPLNSNWLSTQASRLLLTPSSIAFSVSQTVAVIVKIWGETSHLRTWHLYDRQCGAVVTEFKFLLCREAWWLSWGSHSFSVFPYLTGFLWGQNGWRRTVYAAWSISLYQ